MERWEDQGVVYLLGFHGLSGKEMLGCKRMERHGKACSSDIVKQ